MQSGARAHQPAQPAAQDARGALARPLLQGALRECGMPRSIRTDIGSPFVTGALRGLLSLNVFGMRLGIQQQRIHPVSLHKNGAHGARSRALPEGLSRPHGVSHAA